MYVLEAAPFNHLPSILSSSLPSVVSLTLEALTFYLNSYIAHWIQTWILDVLSCSAVSDSCDPMDCSRAGSSVHGIFQARILEWVAISFSRDIYTNIFLFGLVCSTLWESSMMLHVEVVHSFSLLFSFPLNDYTRFLVTYTVKGHLDCPHLWLFWILLLHMLLSMTSQGLMYLFL